MRPEAAETYPLDVLVRDVAVGFNLFFLCIAVPVAIGVVGAELPPDKAEFTWKSCATPKPPEPSAPLSRSLLFCSQRQPCPVLAVTLARCGGTGSMSTSCSTRSRSHERCSPASTNEYIDMRYAESVHSISKIRLLVSAAGMHRRTPRASPPSPS